MRGDSRPIAPVVIAAAVVVLAVDRPMVKAEVHGLTAAVAYCHRWYQDKDCQSSYPAGFVVPAAD